METRVHQNFNYNLMEKFGEFIAIYRHSPYLACNYKLLNNFRLLMPSAYAYYIAGYSKVIYKNNNTFMLLVY